MLYNSQSCQIDIADGTMNYIEFGKGRQPLIILPGLSDGISPGFTGKCKLSFWHLHIKNLPVILKSTYLAEKAT